MILARTASFTLASDVDAHVTRTLFTFPRGVPFGTLTMSVSVAVSPGASTDVLKVPDVTRDVTFVEPRR